MGIRYGGRQKEGDKPRDKTIRVNETSKPDVERFRNLLDNPSIADTAKAFLDELEAMAKIDQPLKD